MSKKSAIRRHVQTNIFARIIYRLICIVLIAVGVFGLFMSFGASERSYLYSQRDRTTTATVTKQTSETDEYGYEMCSITYNFELDGNTYSYESVQPDNYNCQVQPNDRIEIRYQANHPANNAYGDNKQDEAMWTIVAVALTILGIIPLGIGFVGLVAIHKALQTEETELAEQAEARNRKRNYRRRVRKTTDAEHQE